MITREKLKVVVGAGQFDNNPDRLQTQETELNLLKRVDWGYCIKVVFLASAETNFFIWQGLEWVELVNNKKQCTVPL